MTKKDFNPDPATIWDAIMSESTEAHMIHHLGAHQAFVDVVHKITGIYQWDMNYREKMLVALAIKTTLDYKKEKESDKN